MEIVDEGILGWIKDRVCFRCLFNFVIIIINEENSIRREWRNCYDIINII